MTAKETAAPSGNPKRGRGKRGPSSCRSVAVVAPAVAGRAEDEQTVYRVEHLSREAGWLLVYVGVLGLIVPGIFGAPFLLAGAAVLTPGGPKLMSRWFGRNPPRIVHSSLKQISRFLDDVDRRYPRLP